MIWTAPSSSLLTSLPAPPDKTDIAAVVAAALQEDIGGGDVTSNTVLATDAVATAAIRAREPMTVAGMAWLKAAFEQCDPDVKITILAGDGQHVEADVTLATVQGYARPMLAAERTAINFLQVLSGIASASHALSSALRGLPTKLLDTRKTLPGLRAASKYAAAVGGARNHRLRLDSCVLIKDNHLAIANMDISSIIAMAKTANKMVMLECDTVRQAQEGFAAGADWLLLDNMTLADYRQVVAVAGGKVPLEASGGITASNIRAIAETGVDYVSSGSITQSARAKDIGLDIGEQYIRRAHDVPYL